jgi:hypothetical protein
MRRSVILILSVFIFPLTAFSGEDLTVKEAIKEITLIGYTRNVNALTVSSEISGKVLKVHYDVGQSIGDKVFIEIDPTFIDLEIELTLQNIENLDILIDQAASRVAYLEREFERVENLYKRELTTEARKDSALQDLEQASLMFTSRKKEKTILQTKQKELLERKVRHRIYAPKGWVVIERTVEEGEFIQSSTPLARVADYRTLVVPLSVTGEELRAMQSFSGPIEAMLEGKPVTVSVNWVNPEFDEKTRKTAIELAIEGYDGMKRGGLKLIVPIRIKSEGLHIPKNAVTTRYENPTVTLKNTGEIIQLLVIEESEHYFLVADDSRLPPGTELVHVTEEK